MIHGKHTQAMKAQRGIRGIALLFLTRALDGSGWSIPHYQLLYSWERGPVRIVQQAGWDPGLVRTVVGNLAPHYDLILRLCSPKSVATQTMIHVTKQKDMTETEFITYSFI